MAKTPNKPIKKAQLKVKSASTAQTKKAVKAAKPAAKTAVASKAKAKPAKVVSAVKPLKTKEKAPASKSLKETKAVSAKAGKKPTAKPLTKASAKVEKIVKTTKTVKPSKPVKVTKAVQPPKKLAVKAEKPKTDKLKVKETKTVTPKVIAKSAEKVTVKTKTVTVKTQTEVSIAPAAAETLPTGKIGKAIHASSKALARTLAQLPPPPPPPPMLPVETPRRAVTPAALRAFENAVKVFNRQNYEEAKALFESLEQKFPYDGELIGRAHVYIQHCAKKLAQTGSTPRVASANDYYDQGVHALNNGDFVQAQQCFEKALNINPNEPDFLYSLAAAHAQTGEHQEAINYLRRSIQIKPRFRAQAYDDNDFSMLRENRQFLELLGLTSPFELLEQRR